MVKLVNKVTLLTLVLNLLLLSGCIQQKSLEKQGLITAIGYDLDKGEIKGTSVIHRFDPMLQNSTDVITEKAKTSKGLRQEQNLQTSHKLVAGQLRIVVYSKELAKKGINQLVDTLNRDPTIGNMVYLTVCEGAASDLILNNKIDKSLNLGTFLFNLIKQNVDDEQLLSPTLHEFNHNYYDFGKDPVLPIFDLRNGQIVVSGVGLFQDDRLLDELEPQKLFYLKILAVPYKAGSVEIKFNPKTFSKYLLKTAGQRQTEFYKQLYITVDNIKTKKKIKLIDKKNLRFSVDVELESRILEMTEPIEVGNPAAIKLIEGEMGKAIKKEIERLLSRLQKVGTDPIGFGNEYKTHLRGEKFTKKMWRKK
ncbi:MAG: Ger(x)C family spore germination protein, partial [Bacillota bacterium]|nr:Ger(x)C family spore germination protein [Bacillota bacterium]